MGRHDSADELARQFAKEQAQGSIFDADSLMAPMLHVQRPKCWICKKWVREMDEEVTPRGNHILTVRCCGRSEKMTVTRDQLIMMHDRGVKIDMGYAFRPESKIEQANPKLLSVEEGGTAIRVRDNHKKERDEDHA